MRFVSIPQKIEAIQFFKASQGTLPLFVVIKEEGGENQVHNPRDDSWIKVSEGDWIRVDNPKDIYPIPDSYISTKYHALDE